MSYDKYIKYKNKYLQLKAKYTQVGGAGMWTINNLSQYGHPATTPITQEESNAILKRMSLSKNRSVNIDSGTLLNVSSNKMNDYGYTIYSNGTTGTRNSKRGKYDMTLKESTPPTTSSASYRASTASSASAPPPVSSVSYQPPSTPPTASSASYRAPSTPPPVSSASYRAPPPASSAPSSTPPASSTSAKILDLQKEFPNLPAFMSIYESNNPNVPQYTALVVELFDLSFLGINEEKTRYDVNDTKKRDGITFKKINDKQVDMTFKGKKYSLINNGEINIWMHKFK
jgi:hypothetical protein